MDLFKVFKLAPLRPNAVYTGFRYSNFRLGFFISIDPPSIRESCFMS